MTERIQFTGFVAEEEQQWTCVRSRVMRLMVVRENQRSTAQRECACGCGGAAVVCACVAYEAKEPLDSVFGRKEEMGDWEMGEGKDACQTAHGTTVR